MAMAGGAKVPKVEKSGNHESTKVRKHEKGQSYKEVLQRKEYFFIRDK